MAGLNTASRVQERGVAPVRSTMERQRNAGDDPRLTALAATPAAPLGSPILRGVQRSLPLVAFLGVQEPFFPRRERMGLEYTQAMACKHAIIWR